MRGEGLRIVDYLRWAELHIYMTVHELFLTRTRRSGQGPNRYNNELLQHLADDFSHLLATMSAR
jgi:hypothetical protein